MLIITIASSFTYSQQTYNDAQLWFKADIEFALSKRFDPRIAFQSRLSDNFSNFNYFYIDFGLAIKMNSYSRFVIDYVLVEYKQPRGYFSTRHQYNVAWYYKYRKKRFTFVNRILQEAQFKDYYSSEKGKQLQDFYIRDKFSIRYKINKRIMPYVSDEIYYNLDYRKINGLNRNRFYVGVLYNYKKSNQFEIFYMIENNFNVSVPKNNYIIGVGYNVNLF